MKAYEIYEVKDGKEVDTYGYGSSMLIVSHVLSDLERDNPDSEFHIRTIEVEDEDE